jgi:hypothetical protein
LVPGDPVKSLQEAVGRMAWTVEEDSFALIGFRGAPEAPDLACLSHPPAQLVREPDETTLLVRDARAAEVIARHPDARSERGLAWIRFDTAMGWEVVGFLALVAGELSRVGVPIGAVCGFSRDHLFLARPHLPAARAALERLFPRRDPSPPAG